jgi:hypothetical protein
MWIAPSRYPEIRNWISERCSLVDLAKKAGSKNHRPNPENHQMVNFIYRRD